MRKTLQKFSVLTFILILLSANLLKAQINPPVVNVPVGSVINVAADGTMKYWDNTQWIVIPPGLPGQKLQFNAGVPSWINNPFGITTQNASFITSNSAKSGGNIFSNGGAPITARGVCWGVAHNPTLANSFTTDGVGIGAFESQLTSLSPNTTYYVRTYATNSIGTLYGNEISFTTQDAITDFDGNQYTAVQIGTQIWMKENLKTTHFNNGTPIAYLPVDADWKLNNTGAYVYPENNPSLGNTYGALYNWFAVSSTNLCPVGWHVPTDADWNVLTAYLGGESLAGGKLKEAGLAHWNAPNTGATNETGFTALPAGYRYSSINAWDNGSFQLVGNQTYWWSTYESGNLAAGRYISAYSGNLSFSAWSKIYGLSVRCLKN